LSEATAHPPSQTRNRTWATALNRGVYRLSRDWFAWFLLASALFVGLPWLAPALMRLGWIGAGQMIYSAYSFLCHQLPERSFFLFGPRMMYPIQDIQAAWQPTWDPLVLRQFIGDGDLGFKVAWSDRMASMYTSIPLAALAWWPLRKRLRPLPLWAFALLALPMAVDGLTHMASDLAGIGQGFRDANLWLAALTDYRFPATFYAGDALGSFNSWMRLITGALFGLGMVLTTFPHIHLGFEDAARQIEGKFARAGRKL